MYINNGLNFTRFLQGKDIILFGAGRIGVYTLHRLKKLGLFVRLFLDNDKEKWGTEIEGVSVCSLSDYMKTSIVNHFIVVTVVNSSAILEQLSKVGIFNYADYRQLDIIIGGDSYYNEDYFSWQKEYAKIDSEIDASFFQKFINSEDDIAEFGSGGGFLLNKLKCRKKVGIEINCIARDYAKKEFDIESVDTVEALENGSLDIIVSTHALEHTTNPYEILCGLYKKLKKSGKVVIVVPYESADEQYMRDDTSQHLFIWNERVLGNLVKSAGFFVRKIGRFGADYPNEMTKVFYESGKTIFKELTNIRSNISNYHSIFVVGEKY